MSERISDLLTGVQNNRNTPEGERKKAKAVLKLLTKRNKDKLVVDSNARVQVTNFLKELTLSDELTTSMIVSNLKDPETSSSQTQTIDEDSDNDTS
jgi:hypothetical protein